MDYKDKYEELLKEVEELKNGLKEEPVSEEKQAEPKKKSSKEGEIGRELYNRLKQKGKIRGGRN
ncbi:MAG: hypothetical protein ACQEU4_07555 [Bacillota bacterium]